MKGEAREAGEGGGWREGSIGETEGGSERGDHEWQKRSSGDGVGIRSNRRSRGVVVEWRNMSTNFGAITRETQRARRRRARTIARVSRHVCMYVQEYW